jgi:hypothetical protein
MTFIRLAARLTRADIPGLCAGLADCLRGDAAGGTVICDVRAVVRPDVVTVEALARLRLTARRHGYALVVDGAHPRLRLLADLLGLADLLARDGSLELGGQAEQREEAFGVEEVVDARDPPA